MKIAIQGGGVGGALLGSLLHSVGHEVTIFDIKDKYFKPCGDIVPNVYRPPYSWEVEYEIKDFAFYLDGERVYDVSYRSPKWLTINKSEWINSMRSRVRQVIGNHKPDTRDFDYVLDSRGPYPMDREVVYTTRVIMKTEEFSPEAILEFNTKLTGFYWIFPAGQGLLNVGAGFLEEKNSKKLLLEYIKEKFRKYEILDTRGAPISIGKVRRKEGRIGEARGLVFPLSGEGIRPSAISAEIAFNAINKGKPLEQELRKGLDRIESRVAIQSLLLNWYRRSNISMRKTMLRHFLRSEILIDAFLEDKLDLQGIKESVELINSGGINT
ncbi:NAD(P)/FAD-dependent oxidoreductase [Metallosphaera hakonensis]|uniref:NAD(P)/FAD-dependent oxidoreductase n=1 Tax=Metallosphaera hakonensis TaxID=79601 RepID=UPI0014434592|nr:NAD(P)/FAD-dependent oxidoreductase [Metallosphaera hakonensis]